jgi:hypothetical protein
MEFLKKTLAVVLSCSVFALASGNTFKVRYNGGSVASKVDPKDWNNKLTISPDAITLELKDKQRVDIPAKTVTSLSYGQEAHRRVGTMIALAVPCNGSRREGRVRAPERIEELAKALVESRGKDGATVIALWREIRSSLGERTDGPNGRGRREPYNPLVIADLPSPSRA